VSGNAITYPGFDDIIKKVHEHGQDHVFEFWHELGTEGRLTLLNELRNIDMGMMDSLYARAVGEGTAPRSFAPAQYRRIPETDEERREWRRAREAGEEHIRAGRVAAFLVAGGQGTRLGFDGPKGAFPIGPVSNHSLFQVFAEHLIASSRKYKTAIPWLIMTSRENHQATLDFFRVNGYFGYDPELLAVFPQNMVPSLSTDGRLVLQSKCEIFRNPDGHGGSLNAIADSGALARLKRDGIETISYFQVDNPLVNIIDPVFIGFHRMEGGEVSSKGILKTDPAERVGVFVRFDNEATGIVEYSDIAPERQEARDECGRLFFCMGNPAIHLFGVDFIRRLNGGGFDLEFHVARKKILSYRREGWKEIDGFKFEKFVFDAIPLAQKSLVMEVPRDEEFAPVKNREGADSVQTARAMMHRRSLRWLASQNIPLPADARMIEISPLLALEPGDLKGVSVSGRDVFLT
jgi:UDP-N-acetylglucosamine/UDP-N-acetylgalactosamine diphosphorylase